MFLKNYFVDSSEEICDYEKGFFYNVFWIEFLIV